MTAIHNFYWSQSVGMWLQKHCCVGLGGLPRITCGGVMFQWEMCIIHSLPFNATGPRNLNTRWWAPGSIWTSIPTASWKPRTGFSPRRSFFNVFPEQLFLRPTLFISVPFRPVNFMVIFLATSKLQVMSIVVLMHMKKFLVNSEIQNWNIHYFWAHWCKKYFWSVASTAFPESPWHLLTLLFLVLHYCP